MELIDSIKSANRILIVGHMRPDGDCLGAGLALYTLAKNEGKTADVVYDSDLPEHFSFLPDYGIINSMSSGPYDLLLVVDCGDEPRMGKYSKLLKNTKSIQFDHHITNNGFCKVNYVYPEKSSTCEILADLLLPTGKVDATIATYLYIGLSTDTGHFMHNNVTQNVFDDVSKLIGCGAESYKMNMALYRSKTIKKTKLMGCAIKSMRFFLDNKLCIISIRPNDLIETGCTIADTEGLIDLAMDLGCVEVAVCMTEQPENKFKISLRSKGFNVSECAAVFGGGGHIQAAGCVASGMYEDVLQRIVKIVTDRMV